MDHQADLSSLLGEMELSGGAMGGQHIGMPGGFPMQDQRYPPAAGMGHAMATNSAPARGDARMMRQGQPQQGGMGGGMHHGGQGQPRHLLGNDGGMMGAPQRMVQGGNRAPNNLAYGASPLPGGLQHAGVGLMADGSLSAAQVQQLLANPSLLANNPALMQLVASNGAYGQQTHTSSMGNPGAQVGRGMYGGGLGRNMGIGAAGGLGGTGGQMAPGGGYEAGGYYAGAGTGAGGDGGLLGSMLPLGMQGAPGHGQLPPGAAHLMAEGQMLPTPQQRVRASERAVWIREVHPHTTYEEICNEVGVYGPIENIVLDTAKGFAHVHFVDPASAATLCAERSLLQFRGQLSAVSLEKSRPMAPEVATAVMGGATRNLYLNLGSSGARLVERLTPEILRETFGPYGTVESVRVLAKQAIAFVNFTSIIAAVKAKEALHGTALKLPPLPAAVSRAATPSAAAAPAGEEGAPAGSAAEVAATAAAAEGAPAAEDTGAPAEVSSAEREDAMLTTRELHISFTSAQQNCRKNIELLTGAMHMSSHHHHQRYGGGRGRGYGGHGGGRGHSHGGRRGHGRDGGAPRSTEELTQSRSVYVGNLPLNVTYAELCALASSFGPLESVRIVPNTRYAFVNFVSDDSAAKFHAKGTAAEGEKGLQLKSQRLLLNWAKAPPLSDELRAHIARGATRHLHLSGIDHSVSYQMLEAEFGAFGEIESMRILPVRRGAEWARALPMRWGGLGREAAASTCLEEGEALGNALTRCCTPAARLSAAAAACRLQVKATSAFVNFTAIGSAIAAKEALNGVPFKNKTLLLEYAQVRCAPWQAPARAAEACSGGFVPGCPCAFRGVAHRLTRRRRTAACRRTASQGPGHKDKGRRGKESGAPHAGKKDARAKEEQLPPETPAEPGSEAETAAAAAVAAAEAETAAIDSFASGPTE